MAQLCANRRYRARTERTCELPWLQSIMTDGRRPAVRSLAAVSAMKLASLCEPQPTSEGGSPWRKDRLTTFTSDGMLRSSGEPELDHIIR